MIKATYKRKCLIWLIVSEDWHPWWQRKGLAEGMAESSYLDSQVDVRVGILGMVWFFWNLKVTSRDTPPLIRPHLLILSKQFQHLEMKQLYELTGVIVIQATAPDIRPHARICMNGRTPTALLSHTANVLIQWEACAPKGIYTKRSETVKIPKSGTLLNLKRMMHQFQHKSHTFWQKV